MSTNYEISGFRVLKVECNMTGIKNIHESQNKDGVTLKVEDKLSCRRSKNIESRDALLELNTSIISESVPDFRIVLLSQAIFTFTDFPENLEEVLQRDCYPIARKKVYSAIKEITIAMGMAPIDLNKSIS